MGFFAEELSDGNGVSIPIPEGHRLQITQVCLDIDFPTSGPVILRAKSTNDEREFNVCILRAESHQYHAQLNLEFGSEDSPMEFSIDGGTVHLTGNWRWEEDHEHDEDCETCDDEECEEEEGDNDEFSVEEDEEVPDLVPYPSDEEGKKSKKKNKKGAKNEKDAEKEKAEAPVVIEKKALKNKEVVESKAKATENETNDKKSKKRSIEKEEATEKTEQPPKKKAAKAEESSSPAPGVFPPLPQWHIVSESDAGGVAISKPKPVTKKDGLIVTDYVIGKGPLPKPGSFVAILYEGIFPETGETFDHRLKRKQPFTFRRGLQHVIKGMDLGMEGMRVGGARELVIPPQLGYGAKGVGDIPGNQTLVFRIQLIGTH